MAQDAQLLERFQREARAASSLNHPNICTIHAIEQHERQHFIVMELLEGQTLAQIWRASRSRSSSCSPLAIQIADALESAHAKGIVHRDIKPANIFVTDAKQVKILDFGLAKIERVELEFRQQSSVSQTRHRGRRRTDFARHRRWARSPTCRPNKRAGSWSMRAPILFSVGTVLYQMATGSLPFQGDTSAVIFDAILNRDPVPAIRGKQRAPRRTSSEFSTSCSKKTATSAASPQPN